MDSDDETEVDYFILQNIYLDLCYKVVNDCVLGYNQNYIYLSTIPDFVHGNESKFINHTSKEYKSFINDKIEHYMNNKNLYNHKPAIIVLLKIIDIFDKEQDDDKLIILYNRTLNMIQYLTPSYLFINEEYIKKDNSYRGVPNLSPPLGAKFWHLTRVPIVSESLKTTPLRGGLNFGTIQYECITHRSVKESTIIQVYENLPLLTDFKNFLKVIFRQKPDNQDLLKSEFEYIDNNYDLTNSKYDDLKNSIFEAALYTIKNNIDLTYLFDSKFSLEEGSIRYYIYKALYGTVECQS